MNTERLHALDAVRGFALILGVALHAALPFVEGAHWATKESPSTTLAFLSYTIHMFRMPLFFLIAGFFGRMMLESRGTAGFVKDRSRRILAPLVVGLPIIMVLTGIAHLLGAMAAGANLESFQPPPSPAPRSALASINLIHLWFLYYLVIFYATALIIRSLCRWLSPRDERVRRTIEATVNFLTRSIWRPVLLAVLIAAYYFFQLASWSPQGGHPRPLSVIPEMGALIDYGVFFCFGWLLHRQPQLLRALESRWARYCAYASVAWIVCRVVGGSISDPGPSVERLVYAFSYMTGAWCWSFGLIGLATRFLSGYSAVRRYLADASYWIYLMHLMPLFFFAQLLHPLAWHWSIKYLLTLAGSMPILLLSYHYFVRSTFIGAVLNGRRHPRLGRESPLASVTERT